VYLCTLIVTYLQVLLHTYCDIPVPSTATTDAACTTATTVVGASAPTASDATTHLTVTVKADVGATALSAAPHAGATASGGTSPMPTPTPAALSVVVRLLQLLKPYNGTTHWKAFRDRFERICKVNGWTTAVEKA